MLPVILNIKTTKEDFDPTNFLKPYYKNMEVYIPLTSPNVADKATTWLSKFPDVKACTIIQYKGEKILHFGPLIKETGSTTISQFGVDMYGELNNGVGFSINFGNYYLKNQDVTQQRLVKNAVSEFAKILDDTLIDMANFQEIEAELNHNPHNFGIAYSSYPHSLTPGPLITFTNDSKKHEASDDHVQILVTEDVNIVLDEALKYITDSLPAPAFIPEDENGATATEASSASTHTDIIASMAKEIATLKASLLKSEAGQKSQAKLIARQVKTIQDLSAALADLGEMNASLDDLDVTGDVGTDHSVDCAGGDHAAEDF